MEVSSFPWLAAALTSAALVLTYKYLTKNFNYWKQRNVEHPKPWPLVGNFWEVISMKLSIGHYLEKVYKQFDAPYFGIWAFNTPLLVLKDPALVKNVLVKDFQHFWDRSIASDESADSMAANFLFLVKNPTWKEVRAKVTPIFTSGKLKTMFELMNNSANDLVEYIGKHSINENSSDAKEIAAKYTTDVLTISAFGIRANCFKYENAQFRMLGRKMFAYDFFRGLSVVCYWFAPFLVSKLKLKFFSEDLYDFMRKTFWNTIEEREKSGVKRNDLIDAIIGLKTMGVTKDQFKFEGDRIVSQAGQFFAAGFETTSSAIAFTLYELSLNMDVQNKLKDEIKTTFKDGKSLDYEALNSMKYLNKVVSETLRKYPALPFLDRRCVKDYKVPNSNLTIEKGTAVYIPMIALHYDPKYFPNPDQYDPSRFDDENSKAREYAYIPFGDGPHNCVGARFGLIVTKIGLVRVLSEFEVTKSEQTPVPVPFDHRSFILQSKIGLPIRFRRRTSKAA